MHMHTWRRRIKKRQTTTMQWRTALSWDWRSITVKDPQQWCHICTYMLTRTHKNMMGLSEKTERTALCFHSSSRCDFSRQTKRAAGRQDIQGKCPERDGWRERKRDGWGVIGLWDRTGRERYTHIKSDRACLYQSLIAQPKLLSTFRETRR